MNPGWFSQAFWRQVLSKGVSSGTPQVLHVTGLTPVISVNTRAAWDHALAMKGVYCAWSQPGGHNGSQPSFSVGFLGRFVGYG